MGDWEIVVGDCVKMMPAMPPESVDLVLTDPPFNIGKPYDFYDDTQTREAYFYWSGEWLNAAVELLKPNGSLWVMIGDEYAADMHQRCEVAGLTRRNWIIWHYTFGEHLTVKFGRNKAHLLYFVKDANDFTFNADDVRIESERQRIGDRRANPAGRVPGDVWQFPRIAGTFKRREKGHPCQMPEEICQRIILACSNPGDMVLDPFAGTGTTILSAAKNNRKALGIELSTNYAKEARGRVALALAGRKA